MLGYSTKEYVAELASKSPTIDELNEQFRHYASKLQIFSFFETLATSVGPVKAMILSKQSSVLGYQHEVQQSLVADHHDVCKFSSPGEANYQSVRGALQSLVPTVTTSQNKDVEDISVDTLLGTLHEWLGIFVSTDDEVSAIRSTRKSGTCETLLEQAEFDQWLNADVPSTRPRILWAHAPPGSGKTLSCSYVIDRLTESQKRCVHWFFQHRDTMKRSLANMLRSVAYQIAREDDIFRRHLLDIAKSGIQIVKADVSSVWRHLFSSQAWSSASPLPIYWVLDGLDEAESNKPLMEFVSNMGRIYKDIRILIVSRPLASIRQIFQKIQRRTPMTVTEVDLADNLHDIRLVVTDEMEQFPGSEAFKEEIIEQITSRSEGNFLWASLVLERIADCFRHEDVRRVLQTTPDGMDNLYERMIETVANLDSELDIGLSRIILSWAMYAVRPISIDELRNAYSHEFRSIIADLKYTFTQICGQLVVVDSNNRILLVHQTAREYLRASSTLPFPVDTTGVNEELLARCLDALSDATLRPRIRKNRAPPFLDYAALFWSTHMERSSVESDGALQMLIKFFSDASPLAWIQYLAHTRRLSVLVSVSASLNLYVRRRRRADLIKPPMLHRLPELAILETWAADLLKVAGKFGTHLVQDPESIFKYVPSLSPRSSMLHQYYADKFASRISVLGLANAEWDDCLARISNFDGALKIAVSAQYLAVASDSPRGKIRLWNSDIFSDYLTLEVEEPICLISFNSTGSLLACYGLDHTYVWNMSDGGLLVRVSNAYQERAMSLEFGPESSYLIIATTFRRVYRLELEGEDPAWLALSSSLLEETSIPDGAFVNSPSSVAFNRDCTQIAVAYKGFPLAVWNVEPPEMISRCGKKRKQARGRTANATWTGVNRVVWHPFNGQVIGLYRDGYIFKWGPMDDTHDEVKQELDATPSEICCSPDGAVFATSDVKGTVKIYDFSQMVLIYRISSDDIINTIAFSPDSRRFFDLRGSYCNVWEPNCLTRLGESPHDDNASVMSSEFREDASILMSDPEETQSTVMSLATSEAQADSSPAITAVEVSPANSLAFYAKDNGTVELYDMATDQTHEVAQSFLDLGIGQLSVSPKGMCVAYVHMNNRLTATVVKLSTKSGKLLTKVVVSEQEDSGRGVVRQILWNTSNWLLIVGSLKLQVLDAANGGSLISEANSTPDSSNVSPARWIAHPTRPEVLLAFTVNCVQAFLWTDLRHPVFTIKIDLLHGEGQSLPDTKSAVIEQIIPSERSNLHLLVVSSGITRNKRTLIALNSHPLHRTGTSAGSDSEVESIESVKIPDELRESIQQPVGFFPDGRLVFLDEAMWVCTARLVSSLASTDRNSSAGVARHFFVPRDWLNNAGLGLCRIQPDGTFCCPSKGQLAVIKSDIDSSS